LLVSGAAPAVTVAGDRASLEIASILDHEVVVLERDLDGCRIDWPTAGAVNLIPHSRRVA
jgi:hypothetical protein